MDPKVSIVMPVYNCEKYLSDSLDSLLKQTYHDYEIICVDDGSTDGSYQLLLNYANKDQRIKILQQKNQFAGIARNNGMEIASGKYIMFLDSDDIFEKNMLSTLARTAEKNNTDIIYFGFYQFKNDVKHRSMMGIPYHSRKVCSPLDHADDIFHIAQGMPWNKIYNLNFVRGTGIQFQDLQSNNDEFFTKTTVLEAKRILFLNKRFVNYRINNNSSLQGSYKLNFGNFAISNLAIFNEMHARDNYGTYRKSFENFVISAYMLIFEKCQTLESFYAVCNLMRESLNALNITQESEAIVNHPAREMWGAIIDGEQKESLFKLYLYMRTNYAPKTSIEYRVGRELLGRLHIRSYD